jgi:hypothetical protein
MDIRRKGSGRRRRRGRRSWSWSWTLREANFLRRDLYSIETFALLLLGQHLGFAQRVDLCLKKFDLLILSVGFVGGNFDFKGILFVALEEIGRDGLVLIPFGVALSPAASAEKIYFFQLTRHLQINLFQLGLRFIFITLHLTTFINVTSQPHLWSIVSVQWLRCIRCLGTDSSQLGRCRQYGSPWGTGAAYIIIFKNSGNKIKIPTGARRS